MFELNQNWSKLIKNLIEFDIFGLLFDIFDLSINSLNILINLYKYFNQKEIKNDFFKSNIYQNYIKIEIVNTI